MSYVISRADQELYLTPTRIWDRDDEALRLRGVYSSDASSAHHFEDYEVARDSVAAFDPENEHVVVICPEPRHAELAELGHRGRT